MQTLSEFYYRTVCRILPSDRYCTIKEIDDVVVVNFDCVYDRECSIRAVDQLVYLLHKQGKNKRFLFLSEDGASINLTNARQIIENIRDCFHLDKTTCAVVCREELDIDGVTVINNPSIPYWCRVLYHYIKNIPISPGPFNKKFAVWFNRGTFYRLEIAKHLYENYKDTSYISYQESGMLVDRNLADYFPNRSWALEHTPIIYDQVFPNREYNFDLIVGSQRKPYADYFLEIVAETDILSTDWLTEKTVKNLYIGKPFILLSGPGGLEKLHQLGFKTFSPWINETYDLEPNVYLRLEMIKQEIDRLASMSLDQLLTLHTELLPIFEHNRVEYEKYINSR
jgi:hypothetical protein